MVTKIVNKAQLWGWARKKKSINYVFLPKAKLIFWNICFFPFSFMKGNINGWSSCDAKGLNFSEIFRMLKIGSFFETLLQTSQSYCFFLHWKSTPGVYKTKLNAKDAGSNQNLVKKIKNYTISMCVHRNENLVL